jgi:hypothetical protein
VRTDEPAAWFRLYSEFATDPKVQMLSEIDQRRLVMLMCIRCGNGNVTLQDDEIAFQLRVTSEEWTDTKARLIAKNLINESNQPIAWDKRQRSSDSSAERVARHRALQKQSCNEDVTLQKRTVEKRREETEKEKKQKQTHSRFDASLYLVERGVGVQHADDWITLRKAKKLPATLTALEGIESEAAKVPIPLSGAIAECCLRGWGGFKADWMTNSTQRQQAAPSRHGDFSTKNYREGVNPDGTF